jgi:hypothetical protein
MQHPCDSNLKNGKVPFIASPGISLTIGTIGHQNHRSNQTQNFTAFDLGEQFVGKHFRCAKMGS